MSSANTFVLSQTSVISPMGIQQDIVNLDDKLDDKDCFVGFPTDDKTVNYGNHHSENLCQ